MGDGKPNALVGVTEHNELLTWLTERAEPAHREAVTGEPARESSVAPDSTESPRLTLVDVNAVVNSVAPRLRRILAKRATVELSLASDAGVVLGNQYDIGAALIELAYNIRGMLAGCAAMNGTVLITTATCMRPPFRALDVRGAHDPPNEASRLVMIAAGLTDIKRPSKALNGTSLTLYLPRVC